MKNYNFSPVEIGNARRRYEEIVAMIKKEEPERIFPEFDSIPLPKTSEDIPTE